MSRFLFGSAAVVLAESSRRALKRSAMAAALGLLAGGAADVAVAGNIFTGQFGAGNTWNIYEAVDSATSFKEALAIAAARPDPTGGGAIGHLVTIGSLAENDFVHSLAPGERWIGLTDRAGAAPGATESVGPSQAAAGKRRSQAEALCAPSRPG